MRGNHTTHWNIHDRRWVGGRGWPGTCGGIVISAICINLFAEVAMAGLKGTGWVSGAGIGFVGPEGCWQTTNICYDVFIMKAKTGIIVQLCVK